MQRPWNEPDECRPTWNELETMTGTAERAGHTPARILAARYAARCDWRTNTPDFKGDDGPETYDMAEAAAVFDPAGDVARALRAAAPGPDGDGGAQQPDPDDEEACARRWGHLCPEDEWGIDAVDAMGAERAWALFDLETFGLKARALDLDIIGSISDALTAPEAAPDDHQPAPATSPAPDAETGRREPPAPPLGRARGLLRRLLGGR